MLIIWTNGRHCSKYCLFTDDDDDDDDVFNYGLLNLIIFIMLVQIMIGIMMRMGMMMLMIFECFNYASLPSVSISCAIRIYYLIHIFFSDHWLSLPS